MKPEGARKHFLLAFALAAVGYAVLFYGIEARRTYRGPWEITFHQVDATPAITIQQPQLKITNVQILFPGQPVPPGFTNATIRFAEARAVPFAVPFGEVVFLDTTFLPGTVTLRLFGHEIEMLPRVLVVDHAECPWSSTTLRLGPTNASPALHRPMLLAQERPGLYRHTPNQYSRNLARRALNRSRSPAQAAWISSID